MTAIRPDGERLASIEEQLRSLKDSLVNVPTAILELTKVTATLTADHLASERVKERELLEVSRRLDKFDVLSTDNVAEHAVILRTAAQFREESRVATEAVAKTVDTGKAQGRVWMIVGGVAFTTINFGLVVYSLLFRHGGG